MSTVDYDTMRRQECNELIPRLFHVSLPVRRFLCDDIATGPQSYAVLFESGHDLYALFIAEPGTEQTLADVRRMAKNMGIEVQRFFPPHADPAYFHREGVEYFKKAYPGRKQWTAKDIMFYRSLASYSPALVRISAVKGSLSRFNSQGGSWQPAVDYSFRKIRVA